MIFVYQGTAEQGPMYFDRYDADAVAIADPDGELYEAFAIDRGGLREMFGLGAWKAGVRATLKGHLINRKIGDAWTLPTVIAVRDGRIVAEFVGRHAGDHPDVAAIPTELRRAGALS
ncbi:MAG: hypothetical protein AAFP84_11395 [Actinomycetota bacterium]